MVLTDGIAMGPQPGQLQVPDLQLGDVLVWYSVDGGRISSAIREFSGGPYSHVGIYIGDGESIDAGPTGVYRVDVAMLMASCSYGRVMRYTSLGAQRQAIVVQKACSFQGCGYAWFDAITLPARRRNYWSRLGHPRTRSVVAVIGALLIAIRRRWPPTATKTFCSRMVIEAYAAAGIFNAKAVQECAITPLEFAADGNFSYEGWLYEPPSPQWHPFDPYSPEPVSQRRWRFSLARILKGTSQGGK